MHSAERPMEPVVNMPFVPRNFGGSSASSKHSEYAQQSQPRLPVADCDGCLFSLGIVRIELWFGRCFEELKSSLDLDA